jgi:UDP-N-acetylglucosamine--N-acetylmuramyl-(pentapeptide) pyrophosphoryl-undecaprenol N-acetylglucosamine transferase
MKLLIAGGGTGGHLYPGIAVARETMATGAEVLFVGTARGLEARVLPREGLPLRTIRVEGLVGKGVPALLRGLLRLPRAYCEARRILREFRPDVVLGVGGYASGPTVLAAALRGIPTVIQEQNLVPGVTNKILGRFVRVVAVASPEAAARFPAGKALVTGNPIRKEIAAGDRHEALRRFRLDPGVTTILVFGGSAGAHRLNRGMMEALPLLDKARDRVQILHQTGEADLQAMRDAYAREGFRATVEAYLHEMALAYAAADLVLCRAGAGTVAELAACGKAAILVPYPYAAHGHQEANARALERAGAARVVPDREVTGGRLAAEIRDLLNEETRNRMAAAMRAFGKPDAASEVATICRELARGAQRATCSA